VLKGGFYIAQKLADEKLKDWKDKEAR